jgi:hypothetical protein
MKYKCLKERSHCSGTNFDLRSKKQLGSFEYTPNKTRIIDYDSNDLKRLLWIWDMGIRVYGYRRLLKILQHL